MAMKRRFPDPSEFDTKEEEEEEEEKERSFATDLRTRIGKKRSQEAIDEDGEGEDEEEDDDDGEEDEESGSEDDSDENPSDEAEFNQEIEVDFDLSSPHETDFHSVKLFLKNYIENGPFNSSELAEFILQQSNVGSVIKIEDNPDDAFGFISVINLHKYKNMQCVQQIIKYLTSKAPPSIRPKLEPLLKDETCPLGLILSERMVNVPPQLSPALHKTLFAEIESACEAELESHQKPPSFGFEHYILLANTYTVSRGNRRTPSPIKRPKTGEELQFYRPEEEFYWRESLFHYSFPMMTHDQASRWTLEGNVSSSRMVVVVHKSKIPAILAAIQETFT